MRSRYRDIIFLLGAGASVEAGIPATTAMVSSIEMLMDNGEQWHRYQDLYYHIKSAVYYAAGLKGHFYEKVQYNIETLVNILYELEQYEDHVLFPFITSWNPRFAELAGHNFDKVREFRLNILDKLKQWTSPDICESDYFLGFKRLQNSLNFPLLIFSLNYDLCLERLHSEDFRVETGFGGFGPRNAWDWQRFEENGSGPEPPQVYLHKLHGSIDWKRDPATKQLYRVEQTVGTDLNSMELIFGRSFKLETGDPYLFYLYAFRQASLDANLLVAIGYSFGDNYINNVLVQPLRNDETKRLLVIERCGRTEIDALRIKVSTTLGISENQVIIKSEGAKSFLEIDELDKVLLDIIPKSPDAPF
jgi:hypothetical protein